MGDNFRYTRFTLPDDGEYDVDGFDSIAVCGGDGTLGTLLGKVYDKPVEVYYFPSGTLNDRAKSKRYEHAKAKCPACSKEPPRGKPIVLGSFKHTACENNNFCASCEAEDDAIHAFTTSDNFQNPADTKSGAFSYVLATGSFTPIGYMASAGLKQRLGVLAYVMQILKEYKICRVPAKIRCGQREYEGDFTLIMALKSPRCFGFHFNKAFDAESLSGHLIAIRSPKHSGFLGRVEMFFPFFRVFFMGLKKEREGKIIFKRVYSCDILQKADATYCLDGEKYVATKGNLQIKFVRSLCDFYVIDKF